MEDFHLSRYPTLYQANQLQKVLATRHKQEHQEPQSGPRFFDVGRDFFRPTWRNSEEKWSLGERIRRQIRIHEICRKHPLPSEDT